MPSHMLKRPSGDFIIVEALSSAGQDLFKLSPKKKTPRDHLSCLDIFHAQFSALVNCLDEMWQSF